MKLLKTIILILVVFFKTETLFSENDLFNVNNIQLQKKDNISHKTLSEQAIIKGFNQLITKILLNEDSDNLSDLNLSSIKKLVKYYQITNIFDDQKKEEMVNFSVTFDKEKIHDLLYKRGISYSEIKDKELFILPIFIKDNELYIFNNNQFYENWNKIYESDLIEFILPLENIEIIQNINNYKNNLINLDLLNIFKEYSNKNLAIILIEESSSNFKKIYIKTRIQGKNISKSLNFKDKNNFNSNEEIITELKKEIINIVKSKNLIDVRTPSFLNVKFNTNKKNNLVELSTRLKNIDLVDNVFVIDFNKDHMNLRIKYLGKLENIMRQFKKEKIDLKFTNDQWIIKSL